MYFCRMHGRGKKEEVLYNIRVKAGNGEQMRQSFACHVNAVQFDPGRDKKPLNNLMQGSVIARYLFLKIILGKVWKIDPREGS